MNQETTQLIRELAEKLGTTSEYLWVVLVRQAFISSVIESIIFMVGSIVIVIAACILYKKLKDDPNDEPSIFFACITAILTGIVVLLFIFRASIIMAGFFNPEYWALHQLLR